MPDSDYFYGDPDVGPKILNYEDANQDPILYLKLFERNLKGQCHENCFETETVG